MSAIYDKALNQVADKIAANLKMASELETQVIALFDQKTTSLKETYGIVDRPVIRNIPQPDQPALS
jgi:hypothetical protein